MKDPVVRIGKFRGFEIFMLEDDVYSKKPWKWVANLSAERRSYQVEGLKSNVKYNFRVRSCFEYLGCSDFSETHAAVAVKPGQ